MLKDLNDDDYEFLAYLLSEMGPLYVHNCYMAYKKHKQVKPITESDIELCRKLLDLTKIKSK